MHMYYWRYHIHIQVAEDFKTPLGPLNALTEAAKKPLGMPYILCVCASVCVLCFYDYSQIVRTYFKHLIDKLVILDWKLFLVYHDLIEMYQN